MRDSTSLDPLVNLFSKTSHDLVSNRKFVVTHGPIERFPKWMRTGPLDSLAALCKAHRGPLQIAQGRSRGESTITQDDFVGVGGQAGVAGIKPQALLRLGLTVVFGNLNETVTEAKPFLDNLAAALGVAPCISLSAFANAPSSGLPIHHDAHDQLLFQLKGTKTFTRSLRPAVRYPRIAVSPDGPTDPHFGTVYRAGFPKTKLELERAELEEVKLEPGSCLFMPAGTWHRTQQQDETCLSLAMGIRPPSRLDLLVCALRRYLGQSSDWRAPGYGLFENHPSSTFSQAQSELTALLNDLPAQLGELQVKHLLGAFAESSATDGDAQSYLPQLKGPTFIRLPNTKVTMSERDENRVEIELRCALDISSSILQFERDALSLLDTILDTAAAFSTSELQRRHPEFDEDDISEFCMQLARGGLLRCLSVPAYPPDR